MNERPNAEPVKSRAVMDRSRWSEINRIFHAALDVELAARRAFVAAQAHGDAQLQAEVEQLLAADSEAGDYLEAAVVPAGLAAAESPLVAGDVLCGRFRIVREIAEGGMGHVFEAFDAELAVPIALKVIRPEIAANPEVAARFRQEVRLARSITHPNICRTFDLERETRVQDGIKSDLVFLTMEFLPGETLSARIQRAGPVPVAEALAIARQVADALHAAHALGIVHRDMKPSNIMLVGPAGDRAVVTDFGLARPGPVSAPLLSAPDASTLTHSGGPIGTLAYMAPEQLESAPVSPATDIYAFGLVLFEMVSGKRAFPSGNLLSGIAQRMRGSVALEQQLSSETPAGWRTAIRACLQVQPGDRPRDACDVVRIIEDDEAAAPPKKPPLALFAGRPHWRTFAVAATILVGVSLLGVSFFFGDLRLHQWRAQPQVASGALVYLAQVRNQTGEKSFDNLTELIRAGLSQSIQVNLLDQSRVGDILQQMTRSPEAPIDAATAREVAWRAGAVRVIFVTITGSGGAYSMNVDIQQPDSTPARYREHWPKSFAWKTAVAAGSQTIPEEMLTSIRAASDWIRHEAGESANDIARLDTPPEDVTTASWQALSAYVEAQRLAARNQTSDAVTALENAVRIDPRFALAYARMGDILVSRNRYAAGFAAYRQALAAENVQRLTRRELDRIRGIVALDTLDYVTAERVFRDATLYYENDYHGWFYRGEALMMLDRTSEAIHSMQHAVEVNPANIPARFNLASYLFLLGDSDGALRLAADFRVRGQEDPAIWLEAEDMSLRHQDQQASDHLAPLRQHPNGPLGTLVYNLSASLEADSGDDEQAIELLTAGIDVDHAAGSTGEVAQKQLARASLECRLGRFEPCLEDEAAALAADSGPKAVRAADRVLGDALADAPAPVSARLRHALEENLKALPPDDLGPIAEIARAEGQGELLLAEGQADAALDPLRRAATLDAPRAAHDLLASALVRVADRSPHPARRAALRGEARELYHRIVLQPAYLWYHVTRYAPGLRADAMAAWLQLAPGDAPAGGEEQRVMRELSQLRHHESGRVPGRVSAPPLSVPQPNP